MPLIGHAMEARIYSEDPSNNFLPGSGKINVLREPEQSEFVRIDTGVRENDEITTFYDPMISKLIVLADDREKAIRALHSALRDYKVKGLPTNIPFLKRVLQNSEFQSWDYDTSFIAKHEQELLNPSATTDEQVLKAQLAIAHQWLSLSQKQEVQDTPWQIKDNFRVNTKAL